MPDYGLAPIALPIVFSVLLYLYKSGSAWAKDYGFSVKAGGPLTNFESKISYPVKPSFSPRAGSKILERQVTP
jgi:hypothetical protein